MATDWLDWTLVGKLFQTRGAATHNARLANYVFTLGTVNNGEHDERKEYPECLLDVNFDDRYDGVEVDRTL